MVVVGRKGANDDTNISLRLNRGGGGDICTMMLVMLVMRALFYAFYVLH